jgi:hypothetical protein
VACSGKRIEPAQTLESGEVAVGGVQNGAVFDSKSSYLSIGHQVARSAKVAEQREDLFDVIRAWLQHLHRRLPQPGIDVSDGFVAGERVPEGAGIGADPHKAEQNHGQYSNRFGPGQASLPPHRRFGMKNGLGIVGVEQQIDV